VAAKGITVRVPVELLGRVDAEASRRGCSRSEVIVAALGAFVDGASGPVEAVWRARGSAYAELLAARQVRLNGGKSWCWGCRVWCWRSCC
jgi:predicted transcriptional regulator